ncbi:MAG: pyruvate dehydrogenase component, partial [Hyphomicrobiales bacterium]|nr:pyruvate dehydrogenase component [Hyphomicrobiales bacterium]
MKAQAPRKRITDAELRILAELEKKVLWLSSWTIHHANHIRESGDGLKVGGHQASSASLAAIMTALYFHVLRPQDRVAVKPHASPNFHAIQYLLGNQTRDKLEAFRGYKGAQSYPSRTKDADDVDFSTGSVGLGVAQTLFSSLVQDYVRSHFPTERPEGRMVALVGDAEMDEGNIFESMLEGWKQGLRNCWWVIDYNRQSLDAVIREGLWSRYEALFKAFGWDVVIVKHGLLQEAAFKEPGGEALRTWINSCPNQLYSALTFQGGAAWRKRLMNDLGDQGPVSRLIDKRSDDELARLMGNLGGHDLPSLIEAFTNADSDRPTCFICYTIKGSGLALAGHKDNHAGMMTPAQMDTLREAMNVRPGHEWDRFEGLSTPPAELQAFLDRVPFATKEPRRYQAPRVEVPAELAITIQPTMSTQFGFGALLNELGRGDSDFVKRIVTTSPDVTVSTNLGPWVNRRNLFARQKMADVFKSERIASTFNWEFSPAGQHIELGIAENNLFILLSALGLSHSINGERLFPIGTLYDPFIARGLDALNYACYQEARFILVATPSGITLAGEGGAHQSIGTPLIGMAQAGLAYFEPAYADELAAIMQWGFDHMQADDGGSIYLR